MEINMKVLSKMENLKVEENKRSMMEILMKENFTMI